MDITARDAGTVLKPTNLERRWEVINPLMVIPGLSVLMVTALELPREAKKAFFKIPVWLSSSVIAFTVGAVCRGVLGPASGFMTELILWPGLAVAKKTFDMQEKRREKRRSKNGA